MGYTEEGRCYRGDDGKMTAALRRKLFVVSAACSAMLVLAAVNAQQQPGAGGGRGRGTVVTSPRDAYPARPPSDPESVERGRALYSVNCAFCHGADTRGGDSGPSLLRSGVVLDDQRGERIAPVVQNGRADRGMPKFAFSTEQVADIAAFLHTFRAAGYDESRQKPPSILVGDAKAGETYFGAKCASCHSTTGDLHGVAARIPDEKRLQQTWLMPGSGGGRGAPPVAPPSPTAVVTLPSGERVEGRVEHLDDFVVAIATPDGLHRAFRIDGRQNDPLDGRADRDAPKVEIRDPLEAHRNLLRTYSDADIHNVTAFLVTLK